MAFSLSCAATSSSASSLSAWWIPQYLKHRNEDSFVEFKNCNPRQPKKKNVVLVGVSIFSIKSESKDYSSSSSSSEEESRRKSRRLEIGSPIIVTEAPKMIKTATAVPCLRLNSGLVNPGDVGRMAKLPDSIVGCFGKGKKKKKKKLVFSFFLFLFFSF
ncbi:uncharacterized protein LOC114265681 isoform X3 [Camellia sinensis]|nr:uncharacterized protein LOC114265681 isoform X3 [Camellia sinensis]